jgi:limonene 1,2-monooxygenase
MEADIDYLNNNMPRISIPEGVDPVKWALDAEFAVIGTPDEAIARIEKLIDKQGDFGALLLSGNNWADWDQTKRSYELYARYVIPHFAGANRARYDSYDWVTSKQSELVQKRVAAAQAMFAKHEAERGGAPAPNGAVAANATPSGEVQ